MSDAAAAVATPAPGPAPKLDELMLAMDVVDTLRHRETIVERELGEETRDEELKERLRTLYKSQGLEVTDRILEQGIAALKESRFAYEPPKPGLGRTLALMWVKRGSVGKAVAGVLLALGIGGGWWGWQQGAAERAAEAARIEISQTLPKTLASAADVARREARAANAKARVEALVADGEAALARKDVAATNKAITALDQLRAQIVSEYALRIVARQGERTGVFRVPDINTGARNYYIIVEAVAPSGEVLSLPILNEENSKLETVRIWGVRVPQATYDAVGRDKQDDGIVQRNRLGEKRRGDLDPTYLMAVLGGAITKW
ncbi:MAG: hypothetical protein JNM13_16935 [Hyphomicrobiaceae bacterium]|nr:hypothetical protein [Hyphomicrobiaceae bacterium]